MSALASLFVNAKVKFSIIVDGKRVGITLPDCPEGYSPEALAAHFKAKIGKSKRTETAKGVELVDDEIGVSSSGPHVGDFAAAHFARFAPAPEPTVPAPIAQRMESHPVHTVHHSDGTTTDYPLSAPIVPAPSTDGKNNGKPQKMAK